MDELNDVAQVRLFPNPTAGLLNLSISGAQASKATVRVNNLLGATVITKRLNLNGTVQEQIDLSGQAPGTYFVTIQLNDRIATERVVLH